MNPIRVYVVNDNRLVRESVKRLMDLTTDIEVVGASAAPAIAIRDLSTVAADIVLLQCNLLEYGRPCPLQQIKSSFPRLKVLLFGMSENEDEFITAIRFGAVGYLLKESSTEEILEGVRALSRNEAVIPKSLSLALVEFAAGVRTYPLRSATERADGLTLRERQLVPLIAVGLSNKQIADRLIVSEQTVKNHIRSILRKLHVRNRSAIPPQVTHPNLYTNSKPEVN